MSASYAEICARMFETPLMISDAKAAAIVGGLGGRLLGEPVTVVNALAVDHSAFQNGRPSAGRLGDRTGRIYDRDQTPVFDRIGNVAIVGVEGTLVHKGNYVGASSGRTSYQGMQAQIVRAARDPSVKGVVIEADSFGGEVAGVFETADMLAALSRSKPTLAILTDHALSAAYLLASAARSIVIPKSGLAGSIGAIILHADMSGRLEKEGVKVTVLRAGKDKATMNAVEPLSKEKRESVEAQLESVRQDFAARVGQYRSGRFNANQALATEGAEFDGADAVALGLADAVGHANDAFDAFVREMSRA
ncbi:signal peptide peptidase SppA [Rhodoblastus acidophilus]|uniref:Signal peptide peptidase SppA n=1 Tax=Rhodoblastus acidophilus TaxID=1074 RepID=A0A212SFE4_RHOAC|nr:S49 family peptidase [Rhodoblastus acidophilus]PPQ37085.1 hypothetical protein CKO16_15965 [Rhodoblastus acidophilus]RAI16730.1 hypothetical protein CH337_19930 [Rhodoblastus acidophilus]SNB84216.1 signal peptide peptidase SppA [Rhodoblastus acidophilus]